MSESTLNRMDAVFAKQQQHRAHMARTTAGDRILRLRSLRDVIAANREALYDALDLDFRKPRYEVELTEIQPTLLEIEHMIKHLSSWMRPLRASAPLHLIGTRSHVRYEPKGVVLILAPWNYPFNLLMNPLAAAVAAGNTVMVRPSDKTRHTAEVMRRLLEEVFPEEEVAVFTGDRSVADELLKLPFEHIFFTGSPTVGRKVMAAAAVHLASVTLELGGKSPVIVDETADIAQAAERVVWGKFINSGQTCVAPDFAFVHASKVGEFVDQAKRALARFYGETEEERAKSPDLCRIVDRSACERLKRLVDQTLEDGAVLEAGGRADIPSRYFSPTLLSNVRTKSPIMRDEIFGPILPILSYQSLHEVFAYTGSRGKPLALYVFSASAKNRQEILRSIQSGGVCVNNTVLHLANANVPFGGIGESGLGNYHGYYGFKTLSHERAVMVQEWPALVRLFYPPYGAKTETLLNILNKVLIKTGEGKTLPVADEPETPG